MNPDLAVNNPSQPAPTSNRPKSRSVIVIVLIVVGLLLAVLVLALIMYKPKKSVPSAATSVGRQATVNITVDGFIPASLHIKTGTTVVWQNTDASPHHVASNPYPADSSVPGLNSKTMLPNSSYSYKPSSAQTINYHDDNVPTHNGTIVVE